MSLNNRKLVLTVLESGKSKCKVLANSALSWVADVHLLTVSSFGGREKGVETGPTDQYYCIQQQDGVMTVDEYDKREHLSKTYSVPDTDRSGISDSLTDRIPEHRPGTCMSAQRSTDPQFWFLPYW